MFSPKLIDFDNIKNNYEFYTQKKQEIIKKYLNELLNNLILVYYPLYIKFKGDLLNDSDKENLKLIFELENLTLDSFKQKINIKIEKFLVIRFK